MLRITDWQSIDDTAAVQEFVAGSCQPPIILVAKGGTGRYVNYPLMPSS